MSVDEFIKQTAEDPAIAFDVQFRGARSLIELRAAVSVKIIQIIRALQACNVTVFIYFGGVIDLRYSIFDAQMLPAKMGQAESLGMNSR